MSHSSGEDKDKVTLIWTAPSQFRGEVGVLLSRDMLYQVSTCIYSYLLLQVSTCVLQVTFVATVVGKNRGGVSTWWENLRSETVSVSP